MLHITGRAGILDRGQQQESICRSSSLPPLSHLRSGAGLRRSPAFCGISPPLLQSLPGGAATRPCSLAAAKPARVRSTISSRSISARALITWKKKRPAGVLVSMLSVRLRKFTPRACSSDTSVIRSRTLRPSRSSFQTTSTSPGLSLRKARLNPGRLAFFPLAVSSNICSHSARKSAVFCKSRF